MNSSVADYEQERIACEIVARFRISMSRDAIIPLRDAITTALESAAKSAREAERERLVQKIKDAAANESHVCDTLDLMLAAIAAEGGKDEKH